MRRIVTMMGTTAGRYRPEWNRSVRITVVGAVLNGLAMVLLLPLVYSLLMGDHAVGWWLVAALGLLLVAETFARYGELGFSYNLYPELMADIRLRLAQHLRRIPAEELARRRSGELSTVVNQDVTASLLSVSEAASTFLRMVIIPVGLLLALLVIDWRLMLGALLGAAVAAFSLARQNAGLARNQREVGRADAETADRIVEYVQGLPVLKAAGQVGERSERLARALDVQGRALRRSIEEVTMSLTGAAVGANLAVAGIVAVATVLALGAELSAPGVAAIVVAAAGLAEPLTRAAQLTSVFEASEAAMERIDQVFAIQPLPSAADPQRIEGHEIRFEDVTFAYRGQSAPAVRDINLTMKAGTLTAFVGPSGGGKTTITRLISRFADPQTGRITIGGVDVRSTDERELMRQLAVVFQDVHLFDATIAENVAMARPDASREDVLAALEAANCGDLLARLPQGADTPVGEVGGRLSGGERQRVAIARALLKDAPIVLLDEPTSALDTESEVMVQEAIDRLVADRTVVVIAHRLSTVVAADQIVVLDEGQVVEQGNHEQLLGREGRYASMWEAQTRARGWTLMRT